jgi:16S rRNA (adenine1518-N6/adenine1519-N6)-dimethyltransferase
VLEVGAGVGTLTIAVARRARRVVAVELDRDLIPALREVVSPLANVEVVQADILRHQPQGENVVVGNIPYSLTGALIRKLLDRPPRPRRLSFVVQKEVAERWTADTGAGVATVAVQVFAQPRLVSVIPASAFHPPPGVDSALVVMDVREQPAVNVGDLDPFFRFVEAVFQQRRKQLAGTLGRISGIGSAAAATRLRESNVDPERRPQTLSLAEWEAIFRSFHSIPR